MSKNIYTDGTYLKNNPDWGVEDAKWKSQIIADLLKRNSITPSEIIEVGCGSGEILKCLSITAGKNATLKGYDISPQAIAIAKERENEKLHFYEEDFTKNKSIHTQLLLVIDVLEHVDDYYNFLGEIKYKSDHFIFHIPLDLACRTILKPHVLLQQRNSVGHIHYFSKEMVLWALEYKGYTVVDWIYTKPVVDIIAPDSTKRRVKKILRNFSFFINKDISAKLWGNYSMMILAK
jgi:SAM-dependent methyltransferase